MWNCTIKCGLKFYLPFVWLVFIGVITMCWVSFDFTICIEISQNSVGHLRECIDIFLSRNTIFIIVACMAGISAVFFTALYIGLRRKEGQIISLTLLEINETG